MNPRPCFLDLILTVVVTLAAFLQDAANFQTPGAVERGVSKAKDRAPWPPG
jgi:hypothetical protein